MTAREVIREALILNATRAVTTKTNAILDALTSAGLHILGPDDWRDVQTVVEIANRNEDSPEGFRLARALKEKRT